MNGRRLGGRYALGRQIGAGGMAVVYEAVDGILDRRVAVKVLRPEFAHDAQFLRRFSREARAAAQLCHPNIVQVYDVGRDGNVDYIVMEYVDGRTLKDKIQEEAPFKPSVAVNLARQVLEALRHAHQHGVVHRDIKPQNILLTPTGEVKVTDFGIARAVGGSTLADTEGVIGTAHYLSPEQAKGRFTGAQSDLYSLGVVLYEMLAGQLPFDGDTAVTVAVKHLQEQAPPLRSLNERVPPALELIVERALAKDTAQRYGSADDFLADLARYRTRNLDELIAARRSSDHTLVLGPLPEAAGASDAAALDAPVHGTGPDPVAEPRRGRRGLARWLPWAAAALVLFGGAYTGLSFLQSWLRPEMVRVPPLTGATLEAAQDSLAPYQITLHVVATRYDNEHAANVIIDHDPPAGELVRLGSR
ncbi:MAG TPA: Stk1 family PASTA domain-containing Ser/Thr kinase, partial [Bacillota bacterium]